MNGSIRWNRGAAAIAVTLIFLSLGHASSRGEIGEAIKFATSGPFDLYSMPLAARDGLVATTIRIKASDEQHTIDTIRLLSVTGAVHQMWAHENEFDGETFTTPLASKYVTVVLDNFPENGITPRPETAPRDRVFDSYVLPPCDTQLECSFVGSIVENNDESNPLGIEQEPFGTLDGRVDNYNLAFGIGDLFMPTADDAIVYAPGDRPNWTNLAVVVTVADESGTQPASPAFIAFEVLGRDAFGQPLSSVGRFGLDAGGPIPIAFVPEPSSSAMMMMAAAMFFGGLCRKCVSRRETRPQE
jgi:hypothetical protein